MKLVRESNRVTQGSELSDPSESQRNQADAEVHGPGGLGLDATVKPHRTGIRFPQDLGFGAWRRVGRQLFLITDSSAWWLGDWLVYGETVFPDRYRLAVEESGLDQKTLRNYAWVARKYPVRRRHGRLSFQHHAEVAGLPASEQEHWLIQAERLRWSRNELRKQLRISRRGRDADAADDLPSLVLAVAGDRQERWLRAAEDRGMNLVQWVTMTLDEAAGELTEAVADDREKVPV